MAEIDTRKIKNGDLEFDCRTSGNDADPLIIFLHGFPESSFMWEKIMAKISSLGYFCLAPDLRGYSPNACPRGVNNYTIKLIREDILEMANALGEEQFHLIGHDWGAAIGWSLAYHEPKRIISWTALSVPHNRAFGKALKLDKDQRKRSGYIKWFLLPLLPEWFIRKNDFKTFRRLWKHSSPQEVENYLTIFRRKESLTAALNYYRANIGRGKGEPLGDIQVPTLFIWGGKDQAVGAFAAESNHQYMKGPYDFLALDGGHWLIQTQYQEVETAVIEHLAKNKAL
jgi:pimeloyl-ACP methyl ester carboxylesterase